MNNKNELRFIKSLFTISIACIMICLTFQRCQKDDDLVPDNDLNRFSSKEAQLAAKPYVELQDGSYVLNLSSKDASRLGITETDYEKLINEISQLNEALSLVKNDPDNELVLVDPHVQMKKFQVRLKSGATEESDDEPTVRGTLSLSDTGIPSSVQVYIPSDVSNIIFNGTTACFGGAISIKVDCGGQIKYGTILSFSGGSCTINLPMSGLNVKITAETLCSGGATVTYSW
ncbi:MAG: hypothetical protein LLG05_18640 [Porphyromonadaceae bacterium]|nr:hypothetical protein [Porphyromonadaceae bacterium]